MYKLLTSNTPICHNKQIATDGIVNFSMLRELDSKISFKGFSIKYVFQGTENYRVNGNKYTVSKGEYLLGNNFSEGKVTIGSREVVKGLCIDINPDLLSEVVASFLEPSASHSDIELDSFFTSESFFENKYFFDKTNLGQLLFSLGSILDKNPFENHEFTKDFFFELAESLVLDHQPILKQLNSINSLKIITKKELYRKVLRGKDYIDNNYLSKTEIKTAAKEANMSEYHFFRIFKSVFNISPLQYIIFKRLEVAKQLLQNKVLRLSDIAVITGFADMNSLSKAFKKQYGTAPTKLILE